MKKWNKQDVINTIQKTTAAENRSGRIKRECTPPFSGEGQDAESGSDTGPDLHA